MEKIFAKLCFGKLGFIFLTRTFFAKDIILALIQPQEKNDTKIVYCI